MLVAAAAAHHRGLDNEIEAERAAFVATCITALSAVAMLGSTVYSHADPVAVLDTYSITENTLLFVMDPGVLANDIPDPGASITASLFMCPIFGTVVLNADGSFFTCPSRLFRIRYLPVSRH